MDIRKSIATVGVAGAVVSGSLFLAAPANAANQFQDGLVNVAVGDISLLDNANIGVAAQIAANVCGVSVGPVAVLGQAVDRSGSTATVCTTPTGPVTISQNQ